MNKVGRILYALVTKIFLFVPGYSTERVRVILINESGNVLMVRSWLSPQQWSLPGGGVERGETREQACVREIKEETGFSIDETSLQFVTTLRSERMHADLPIFVSRTSQKSLKPLSFPYNYEIIDRQWFPPDQLPGDITGYSVDAIKLALLSKN